jgi:hypothetical protein
LAQLQTYALVRVSDHPCSKIRKNCCTHVCYIQRTYIFSLKFGLHWNHLLYFQSYIHVRKWIFCKHPWMVKLLIIGVLYLNGKVWGVRRCVNCRKNFMCISFLSMKLWLETISPAHVREPSALCFITIVSNIDLFEKLILLHFLNNW